MLEYIHTHHLLLREVNLGDLRYIHDLHSLEETNQYNTLGIPESVEITQQLITEWLALAEETPRKKYVFYIETISQSFVGIIGINIGKPHYRNAEIWFKLSPTHWNKGYGTEAVKAILKFGFNQLGLHRMEAGCVTENIASIRVLEKAGFAREGHLRKLIPIRGQWFDNYSFAILEEDFI
jgi:RimJ/RimL family protein N-acetyltransferase